MSSHSTSNGSRDLGERFNATSLTNAPKHKIIVGIDYGTTFSGVSFVTTDKSSIDDITIMSKWPGDSFGSWKTPTRIAYSVENPRIDANRWGFEVSSKLKSYSWTKLLLDENAAAGEYDDPSLSDMAGPGMFRLPPFRDAPGVCEDFLHEVYVFVSAFLRRQLTDSTFERTPMECWITLPAIWSDRAKAATLTAARNAGFSRTANDEVFTIAEPEAAAIAALTRYAEVNALNPIKERENILICDCGGGTVDITTYKITQVQPYLAFDELCVGIGGKCGSTYIDRNLHVLLSQRFGSAFDNLPFGAKGPGSNLMLCFEGLKRDFGRRNDDRELGPVTTDVPDSEYYDVYDRNIKLSYKDMEILFDPVINDITDLVGQQVEVAEKERNAAIDRIILVGGFGESAYLNKALSDWCQGNGGITLICPQHPQVTVVQGAALRGLTGIAPRVKRARRHYGIAIGLDFRKGIDPEEYSYIDQFSENRKMCRDRMRWLISKGDEINIDTYRTADLVQVYSPGYRFVNHTALYSCALTEAPEYATDHGVDNVGSIESHLSAYFDFGSSTRSRYIRNVLVHQFSFKIKVTFRENGDNLAFKCVVNGQEAGSARIRFEQ